MKVVKDAAVHHKGTESVKVFFKRFALDEQPHTHPRTTFQVRAWFQKDEPSSRLKSVPPIGAPKAAATPAAAPAETKSLLSLKT